MLTIRLSRIGKTKKPMYRLIISEKARDPYGRALEILGSYNPFTKDLQVQSDRIIYWMDKGAQVSTTAYNLLISKQIIQGKRRKATKISKKRAKKLKEKEVIKEKDESKNKEVKEENKKKEQTEVKENS